MRTVKSKMLLRSRVPKCVSLRHCNRTSDSTAKDSPEASSGVRELRNCPKRRKQHSAWALIHCAERRAAKASTSWALWAARICRASFDGRAGASRAPPRSPCPHAAAWLRATACCVQHATRPGGHTRCAQRGKVDGRMVAASVLKSPALTQPSSKALNHRQEEAMKVVKRRKRRPQFGRLPSAHRRRHPRRGENRCGASMLRAR
mmetsp:Transcript_60958/g.142003  ORF Transcript_60958/g.142003 Transcript_60958/m.142003 type:complete len:204 (-) Transcript_60958:181-792(-)